LLDNRGMSAFRRLFSLKTVRVLIFIGAALVVLSLNVVIFENWRGKRAWRKFKSESEAAGERFDLASFIPKSVPDSENFAATPFFAPLFDYHTTGNPPVTVWHDTNGFGRAQSTTLSGRREDQGASFGGREKGRLTDLKTWQSYYRSNKNFSLPEQPQSPGTDILHALSKYDDVFSELREAAKRPHAVYPIHYAENFSAQLKHLTALRNLGNIQRLRTLALLSENNSDQALAELRLSLRFAESLKGEPILLSLLIRLALLQISAETVWEGMCAKRWNEQHLTEIQSALSSIDLFPEYPRVLRTGHWQCSPGRHLHR
jgi:hypothetical protein